MRASLHHVAERAGVSRMTVSNVMRGRHKNMTAATRQRVLDAVRELEYVPVPPPTVQSRHAATRIIGLVFDSIEFEGTWGLPTYRGMRESARELGYDLLTLLRTPENWLQNQEEMQFLDKRTDGLIFVVPNSRYAVLEKLVRHGVPAVSCFTADVPPGVATIQLDDAGATATAVQHLLTRGHRRIAHFAGPAARTDFHARRQGFEAAMQAAGLAQSAYCVEVGMTQDWPAHADQLLQLVSTQQITAVCCASDDAALALWRHAEACGYSVPRQLSIVGIDDLPQSAGQGLTTFRFSCEDIGALAVDAVVKMITGAGEQETSVVVPVHLVERASVAPPQSQEVLDVS